MTRPSDGREGRAAHAALVAELRRRRKGADLSQAELADRVGYSREYVSRAERAGRGLCSADLARVLDSALDANGVLVSLHAAAKAEQRRRRRDAGEDSSDGPVEVASGGHAVAGQDNGTAEDGDTGFMAAAPPRSSDSSEPGAWPAPPDSAPPWVARTWDAVLHPSEWARSWAYRSNGRHRGDQALQAAVDEVMLLSLGPRHDILEGQLPGLIGRVEFEAMQRPRSQSLSALSDVYAVAAWTLIKADAPGAARVAADRALRAGEEADDLLRVAAATRCLAEVHMRAGDHGIATRTAVIAAVTLDATNFEPDAGPTRLGVAEATARRRATMSLRGAALLSAAAAAARGGEAHEARVLLRAAAACAQKLGADCYEMATVFGPTNVAIHEVAIAVELGNARQALHHTDDVNLDRVPALLAERKARYLLDVARAHTALADHAAATAALLQAEQHSADEVHHHRITRSLLPALLAHSGSDRRAQALASRCGLTG